MKAKELFGKKTFQQVQEINVSVFPVLVLFFLLFALVEEFKPGFVTFYISQWVIILPVLASGILFATTEQKPDKTPPPPQWVRLIAVGIFQILFSAGFFWKVEIMPPILFWGIYLVSSILFFLFQIALLFSDGEIKKASKKGKKIMLQNLTLALSLLFLMVICITMFFFFLWVKNPYFFKFQDTVPVGEIWEKAITVPEIEEE